MPNGTTAYSFDVLNYARSSGWIPTDIIVGSHDTTDGRLSFIDGVDNYYRSNIVDLFGLSFRAITSVSTKYIFQFFSEFYYLIW